MRCFYARPHRTTLSLGYTVTDLLPLLISQAAAPGEPSCATAALPFLLMLSVFYFLIIRPQRKQEVTRQETLSRIKADDTVITSGGLIGVVKEVKQSEFMVEIAPKVCVRVAREDVDPYQPAQAPAAK